VACAVAAPLRTTTVAVRSSSWRSGVRLKSVARCIGLPWCDITIPGAAHPDAYEHLFEAKLPRRGCLAASPVARGFKSTVPVFPAASAGLLQPAVPPALR